MENVLQLMEKLDGYVMELGLDPKYKESPAYKKVLAHVDMLISTINIDSLKDVSIRKDDGIISFVYTDPTTRDKYKFELSVPEKDELRCTRICESTNYNMGRTPVQKKSVVEVVSKIDSRGQITITTEVGQADSLDCGFGNCNVWRYADRKIYDSYGVQESWEIESYPNYKANRDVSNIDTYAIIRGRGKPCFDNYYVRRTNVRRRYLDVVNIWHEDKETGEKYSGFQEMHSEHGLQDLDFSYRFEQPVVIYPLMTAEIEQKLSEEDPKVAEGLRRYTEGREKFEYDSEKSTEYSYRASY